MPNLKATHIALFGHCAIQIQSYIIITFKMLLQSLRLCGVRSSEVDDASFCTTLPFLRLSR